VFVKLEKAGSSCWYNLNKKEGKATLDEMLYTTEIPNGEKLYNGAPKSERKFYQVGHLSKIIVDGKEVEKTGSVGPFEFIKTIEKSEVVRFSKKAFTDGNDKVTVWYQQITKGEDVMKPGLLYKLSDAAGATIWDKLNFLSLMLALFLGTSALPHILIRYYTVPSQRAARKSTIVAIAAIGFFYVL
ncbi:MAG: cation acetate symporter, partial [Ignavibacteriae bacterium]|nr:cation acetate symporter [Ignavibacteriota bacterium]